jgi:cellulose biosynthesis protein BcsQ
MPEPAKRRAAKFANPSGKGGTGKSVLMQALAEALASAGAKVLLVDLDWQANLTRRLAATPGPDELSVAEVLDTQSGKRPVQPGAAIPAIRPCGWRDYPAAENIDVLPARADLELREMEAFQLGAIHRLATAMHGIDEHYDWVFVDCHPSLGHLAQMALLYADAALLSVNAENDAISAAVGARNFIELNKPTLGGGDLHVAGVITNAFRSATSLHKDRFTNTLPELFTPEQIWTPTIPQAARIADTLDAAKPLLAAAPKIRPLYEQHAATLEARYGRR